MGAPLTPEEAAIVAQFFTDPADVEVAVYVKSKVRRRVGDDSKAKNILDQGEYTFTDENIYGYILDAIDDINTGTPKTSYSISELDDPALLSNGAIVMALIARGIVETKNGLNFSDQGLTVNTYDKGPAYMQWVNMMVQSYEKSKADLKNALAYGDMFVGIRSPMGR